MADGVQTRELKCKRKSSDGSFIYVDKDYCTYSGLTMPELIQECNTHMCGEIIDFSLSIIQDTPITITTTDVLNKGANLLAPLTFTHVLDMVGGTAVNNGVSCTFTPNVKTGQPARFRYRALDNIGRPVEGLVTFNILRLPDIRAYILSTDDLNVFKITYKPPTLSTIFSTWARYSNNTSYYPAGTTPSGEAASWEMISSNQFRCTVNSSYWTGFISPNVLTNYTHEATFSSTDSDDDTIGLLIAYKRENEINKCLIVGRDCNGTSLYSGTGFGLLYTENDSSWTPNGTTTRQIKIAPNNTWKVTGGWNSNGKTRVKVERLGSIVRVWCSKFKSEVIDESSKIEIDLNDYPYLSWALDPCSYGYCCMSQKYSSFTNAVISGDINREQLLDFQTGEVWDWDNQTQSWIKTVTNIQSVYGWPRTIISETDNKKYQINENNIEEIL